MRRRIEERITKFRSNFVALMLEQSGGGNPFLSGSSASRPIKIDLGPVASLATAPKTTPVDKEQGSSADSNDDDSVAGDGSDSDGHFDDPIHHSGDGDDNNGSGGSTTNSETGSNSDSNDEGEQADESDTNKDVGANDDSGNDDGDDDSTGKSDGDSDKKGGNDDACDKSDNDDKKTESNANTTTSEDDNSTDDDSDEDEPTVGDKGLSTKKKPKVTQPKAGPIDPNSDSDLSLPVADDCGNKVYPDMTPDGKFSYQLMDKASQVAMQTKRRRLRRVRWLKQSEDMTYDDRKAFFKLKHANREEKILAATLPQREAVHQKKRKERDWREKSDEIKVIYRKSAKLLQREKKKVTQLLDVQFPVTAITGEMNDKHVSEISHLKYIPKEKRAFTMA